MDEYNENIAKAIIASRARLITDAERKVEYMLMELWVPPPMLPMCIISLNSIIRIKTIEHVFTSHFVDYGRKMKCDPFIKDDST